MREWSARSTRTLRPPFSPWWTSIPRRASCTSARLPLARVRTSLPLAARAVLVPAGVGCAAAPGRAPALGAAPGRPAAAGAPGRAPAAGAVLCAAGLAAPGRAAVPVAPWAAGAAACAAGAGALAAGFAGADFFSWAPAMQAPARSTAISPVHLRSPEDLQRED